MIDKMLYVASSIIYVMLPTFVKKKLYDIVPTIAPKSPPAVLISASEIPDESSAALGVPAVASAIVKSSFFIFWFLIIKFELILFYTKQYRQALVFSGAVFQLLRLLLQVRHQF